MGKQKPSDESYILEFILSTGSTTNCCECKKLFVPEAIYCNIMTPMEGKESCHIKWIHFQCASEQQNKSFTRVPLLWTVKGFDALSDHQKGVVQQQVEKSRRKEKKKRGKQKGQNTQPGTDDAEEGSDASHWDEQSQEAWANFLVTAVHDAKLAACATAQIFDREDTEIEIRRASKPYALSVEDQVSRIACLIIHCRDMPDDSIRTIARTLSAQVTRSKNSVREDRVLPKVIAEGNGRVAATAFVHGHYRGKFHKGDTLHLLLHGEPATVYVYNAEWEQVGELSVTSSALLAPLMCQSKFKFTSYVRIGNVGDNGTGTSARKVTQIAIGIALETIEPEVVARDGPAPLKSSVLGVIPSVDDSNLRRVIVICPTITELIWTFTLRWWPGDEEDCFFDLDGLRTGPGLPHELMLLYSDETELLSLEEEWERTTGDSLGGVEKRYSVPVGSYITVCKRDDRTTIAILHTPSFS